MEEREEAKRRGSEMMWMMQMGGDEGDLRASGRKNDKVKNQRQRTSVGYTRSLLTLLFHASLLNPVKFKLKSKL